VANKVGSLPEDGSHLESSALAISDVAPGLRWKLMLIIDQSFHGLYRWHARRTLRLVTWVRQAARGGIPVGLTMSTMIAPGSGYLYYFAVTPSARSAGVGGLLLDDVLAFLKAAGATEVFACVRDDNVASQRLMKSKSFSRTAFREVARSRGARDAVRLWTRMVVAPGERVFRRA